MAEEPFKTNDMGMVTYLRLQGHVPQKVEFEGPDCWWSFVWIQSLIDEVDKFLGGNGWVRPQEYNRQFGITKREMGDARSRQGFGQRSGS